MSTASLVKKTVLDRRMDKIRALEESGKLATKLTNRTLRKVLSNKLAVLGAVLLDGGFPAAEAVFARLFADDVAALSEVPAWGESPKSALQVLAARAFREQPAYRILSQDGPPDAPSFVAEASVAGRAATGAGRTKQAAQTAAAAALLALLAASR